MINSLAMLCTLILKLPMSNGDRWDRRVQFNQKNQLREPDPTEFVKFDDKETDLVNDPWYSGGAVAQHIERKERERVSERGSDDSRLAIQFEEDSKEKGFPKGTQDVITCVICAKNHK